jgi:hypothetical protein
MKKIYLFVTVVVCFFNQNIYSQQCRNTGGNSPQQPATIYIGDDGTFGHQSWATHNGNWPQWQIFIHTSSDVNNGTAGSLSSFSSIENKTSISPRFTSTGTWYWGMKVLYSTHHRWYCRNDSNWHNMWETPTSDLTITVLPLENPSDPISITTVSDSQLTLNWTKWNSKNVMIVRRLTSAAISNAPTAGTAYSVGVGAPQLGTGTVVYNSNGTSFTDTNLSPGESYTYTLYSENYSYYSSGVTRTGVTSVTWNGTSWSNTNGPTSSLDAIIAGDFSTTASGDTAGFTAKSLTVNSGKTFTVNTGHTVTVAGAITNSGTFAVNNSANLLQTNVSATNTGSIVVKRNSANIQLYDYTLWSSPVAGQKLKAFSPDTLDARFYSYNSGTNLYNVVSAPATTDFASATGYLIRTPNTWAAATPTTFNGVFTGVPNNGDISFTMSVGALGSRYNLVGNPYPSPISIASFVSDNSTITGTLYFWRKTNGTGTAYCTYAGTTYTSNGNAQAANPNGIIQTGQGFFVEASGSGTALLFKNSQRVSNTANQFFRSNIIENNRIWLNATNSSGAFSQMAVGYMTDATQNVDSLDGKYINDSPFALTSLINSEEYTIQGRALPFSTSDSVPLGFKTNVAGNYNIAIDHVDGLFSNGQAIYLKDNLLNIVTNLGVGSYSFASAAGTFNSRFEIVYQSILGVNNPEFTSNNVVAFNENGDININSGSTVMEQVRVYDLQGRLLVEKKQINASETRINTTAVNQVLLLEITATTGSKVIKKIIK